MELNTKTMLSKKTFSFLFFSLLSFSYCQAQIEVVHATVKDFKKTGFGGFLNCTIPASEANYLTLEAGVQYFKNEYDEDLGLIPVLLGYRCTLDQSGYGLFIEPNAGYTFGSSTIGVYDEHGAQLVDEKGWAVEKVAGPMAGVGVGYMFEPFQKSQLSIGIRYEHTFGKAPVNVFAFRISYGFSFGRRD